MTQYRCFFSTSRLLAKSCYHSLVIVHGVNIITVPFLVLWSKHSQNTHTHTIGQLLIDMNVDNTLPGVHLPQLMMDMMSGDNSQSGDEEDIPPLRPPRDSGVSQP